MIAVFPHSATIREKAFAKIQARVEGTDMATKILGGG